VLRKGLSPLATTISTEHSAPVIAGMRLRARKTGSGKGAGRMVAQAIATARAAGPTGKILVRGDSAYGNRAVVRACMPRLSPTCWKPPSHGPTDRSVSTSPSTLAKRSTVLAPSPDRGSSMTSKPVAFLLADLGVTQSHSRPHVSDDDRSSEAQFKILKYRPGFPDRFDSIEAARLFYRTFFAWYKDEHHHSGLGLHTAAGCTTAPPGIPGSSRAPTPPTPSRSSASHQHRRNCQPPPGSTDPTTQRRQLSNFCSTAPHSS